MKPKITARVPEYEVYRKEGNSFVLVHTVKGLSRTEVMAKFISFIMETPGFYGVGLDSIEINEIIPQTNVEINCRWSGYLVGSSSLTYANEAYRIVKI
jgi:hypothetical protein